MGTKTLASDVQKETLILRRIITAIILPANTMFASNYFNI